MLLFVLYYVLFVCKCVLPPGDNPTAVNKYIIYIASGETLSYHCHEHRRCQDTATDVGFQCDKSAVLGEIIKQGPVFAASQKNMALA